MSGSTDWFACELRVRYQETDQMGVVYHGNYINWFEIGRTELIREMGVTYRDIEAEGLLLPLIDMQASFHRPALYDDRIAVYTRIDQFTHTRMTFASEVRRLEPEGGPLPRRSSQPEGELLVSGSTRHVWVNRQWRPIRLDRALPQLHAMLCRQSDDGQSRK